MSLRLTQTEILQSEVDAIRAKMGGVSTPIEFKSNGFADAILDIPSGGEEYDWSWFSLDMYLNFEALEPNSTISLTKIGSPNAIDVKYSYDGFNWNNLVVDETIITLNNVGDKVYLKNNANTFSSAYDEYYNFVMTGKIAASGNVNSMINNATTLSDYCYCYMFYGCTSLTTAPELPSTELANYCYSSMFRVCKSLVNAPELPATELADYCYSYMFSGCTSLVNAPELQATTLSDNCYSSMFSGCTSLVTAPELQATTLANECYIYMFSGCTSLVNAPKLPATTLADNCYGAMFEGCTSLVTVPALPATTLASYCYYYMFFGCTSLKFSSSRTGSYQNQYRIPVSGTGTTASDALADMFLNTGGTFKGTPSINTTYYTSNEVIYP